MKKFIICLCFIFLIGCVRTVYVPHGAAVRLRETIKDVKVWVKTENGETVPGKIDLPEGWYCLPLEEETNGQ